MELTHTLQGPNVLVIQTVESSLDASNVREFRDQLQSLIQHHARVVLDMSSLKFVDSSGLGALIACLRELNARKGELRLSNMSRSVLALFELMRMHRVFGIYDTVPGALDSFAEASSLTRSSR